jgi:small subunit ribosomal protein S6
VSEIETYPYEAMFLFPPAVSANLQAAVDHINTILDRASAEVISMRKWDERRLAYEIKGNKRGIYFLVYFRAASDKLTGIERDCNLSEQLLRSMVTRADHVTDEQMQAADGRAELADEIKLRKEAPPAEAPKVEVTSGDDSQEPASETAHASADAE